MSPRKIRVAINGFGRVGRQLFKAIHENYRGEMEVVAINEVNDLAATAHLLRYDSAYGHFLGAVAVEEGALVVDGERIPAFGEAEPAALPWGAVGVDVVIEATGRFTDGAAARAHLAAGARKVIITAPSPNADLTICLGANEAAYDPTRHHVLSNTSCTTHAVAPIVALLQQHLGVRRTLLSTVHAYTSDQPLLDAAHRDARRARAAALNIIPTTTRAAEGIVELVPSLAGQAASMAFRVPVPAVSAVTIIAELERATSRETLNALLKLASEGDDWLGEVLGYSDEPLVSSDYIGNPTSATIDGLSTEVVGGTLARIVAWYDNEWGYANRVADLVYYIAYEVESFEG